jgi:hypothetical protein
MRRQSPAHSRQASAAALCIRLNIDKMSKPYKKLNAFVVSGFGIQVLEAPSTSHFIGSDHLEPLERCMGVAAIIQCG